MISFITAFKKFKGPYDMIQHSALYSWNMNDIKVVAPLNEVGLKEKCAGYPNLTMIEGVRRARELGFSNQCPIVKDLIAAALPHFNTTMVALINSDIIITDNFLENVQKMVHKYGYDIYAVGSRYDIQLNYSVNDEETYKKVQQEDRKVYDVMTSSDIFITSKFIWRKIIHDMPDFILGRYGWDNWLHMYAEINSLKKMNCSEAIPILHCVHDHMHIFNQEKAKKEAAASSQHNIGLWNKVKDVYGTTKIGTWPKVEI